MTTKTTEHDEELKKSQQQYRNLFENEVVGMYRSKLDGSGVIEVNQALCDKLGYTREEILSEPSNILWADPRARIEMVNQLKKHGSVLKYEADFVTKSGEIRHCLTSLKLYPQDGYIEGIAIDITERKRTEEALRKVKDFNETIIQASPAFFVAISPEGKTIMMNEAMLHALGYSLDEVVGKDYLTTFVPESNREMLSEVFQALVQAKKSTHNENFILTRDGRHLLVEWYGRFVFKENDELDFFFGVGIDMTERRLAEEEQRRSEAKYRLIIENMNDIIWTTDMNFNITYMTPSVVKILGFTPEERLGQNPTNVLTPESKQKAVEALFQYLEEEQSHGNDPGKPVELELEYYHKNGSIVWMECVTRPIRDNTGRITGFHGVARDITNRRRAESALRESEKRFRSLIQNSLDIIIILDRNGFMTHETPSLENILGYQPGYLIGKSPFELIHPADLGRVTNDLNEVYLKSNPGIPTEFRCRKVDDTWVYLEAIGQNLLEDPAINGIVITARDISERKQAEEELKKHRDYLEDVVKERTADLNKINIELKQENEARKTSETALRSRELELEKGRKDLQEMNSALKVLLKQREDDKVNMEMNIISNIKTSVLPYIEKLELSGLEEGQRRVSSMIKSLLEEITSPFIRKLSTEFLGFTPNEIQVASLIKEGKSSKEIAEILNISLNTVHTYRYKIRIKTGLKNNKMNLRSYLQTLG